MKNEFRDEFFELLNERLTKVTASVSISLLAIIDALLYIAGKPEVLVVSLYLFILSTIILNSIYILVAKRTKPDFLVAKIRSLDEIRSSKFEEKSGAKYPHLRPIAFIGLVVSGIIIAVIFLVPSLKRPVVTLVLGTPTSTPTQMLTLTPPPTFTITPSATVEPPIWDYLYYMIVLDASEKMKESFHGKSKWDVAVDSLNVIINGLNPYAKYSLVVIGGSNSSGIGDPCGDPSTLAIPFSGREIVWNQIGQLQPHGGGSFYTAFTLAKNQLQNLPSNAIRTLIYITGSNDACESRNEWDDLERILKVPDSTVGIYSEIIILDENAGLETQTITERISSLSENLNVQIPQNTSALQQSNNTVINNVMVYVENKIETRATEVPSNPNSIFTATSTSVSSTSVPQVTPVIPTTPMPTPPPTSTPTPIPPTPTLPPPTATLTPFVELSFSEYIGTGIGCEINTTVQVSGSPATGSFHAWNASYGPEGDIYPPTTFPVGITSGYRVKLGGDKPEYYKHNVWFKYDGRSTIPLTDLICPGLTLPP